MTIKIHLPSTDLAGTSIVRFQSELVTEFKGSKGTVLQKETRVSVFTNCG